MKWHMKTRVLYKTYPEYSVEVQNLLQDGWEPFVVTVTEVEENYRTIYFRKQET